MEGRTELDFAAKLEPNYGVVEDLAHPSIIDVKSD